MDLVRRLLALSSPTMSSTFHFRVQSCTDLSKSTSEKFRLHFPTTNGSKFRTLLILSYPELRLEKLSDVKWFRSSSRWNKPKRVEGRQHPKKLPTPIQFGC